MRLAVLLIATAVAGCTTTIREARGHAPSATYESTRPEPALEHCLAGNLSWMGAPAIIHGEEVTELSFGGANSVLLVTLKPTTTGTHVEARELLAYGARIRHNVEACVTGRDQ